jgi:hypothetical protein
MPSSKSTPKKSADSRGSKASRSGGSKPDNKSGEVRDRDLDKVTGGTAAGLPTGKRMHLP